MWDSETEGSGHEVVPEDEQNDNDGNGDTGVQPSAVGVCLAEVLGELAAIGFDIGHILGLFALSNLLLTLGLSDKTIEFILAFGGVDVDATETTWTAGGEEGHI